MKTLFYVLCFCLLLTGEALGQTPILSLQTFASGFNRPVDIAHAGDDRIFVVEQDGTIRIIDGTGTVLSTPFLNIDPIVGSTGNEQGLLGLAFHPNYSSNGFFYVNYTNNSGNTHVSRFTVTANPNVADPASELIIYSFNQDFSNHNGGDLNFGPNDGYLYIATGDGGSGGDPNNRAQNTLNAQGKMLRIDVDNPSGGNNYGIPADNPFVGSFSVLDEIWALGLRNPWRFSFDRTTGDMYIGDVGQGNWEEINFQPASSNGGENYGWRCYEGNNVFNTSGCGPIGNYTFPIHEYLSNFPTGCSITGGYVYRGSAFPNMIGKYFYADYCAGNFWFIEPDGMGGFTNTSLANLSNWEYASFGEDVNGELYVTGLSSGNIFRIIDNSIVLPITLSTFTTEVTSAEDVLLKWTTVSETNSALFDIERSFDGHTFEKVGTVNALESTSTTTRYQFTDQFPVKGTSYYRLKMIDLDGEFRHSDISVVYIEPLQDGLFSVYPNPVKPGSRLELAISDSTTLPASIKIFSGTGQLIDTQTISENFVDLPGVLPVGLYFISLESAGGKAVTKLLIY
ncbi:MAG: PQQ-dependent sugar dehydrogenase [Bacteroidota bacterium]